MVFSYRHNFPVVKSSYGGSLDTTLETPAATHPRVRRGAPGRRPGRPAAHSRATVGVLVTRPGKDEGLFSPIDNISTHFPAAFRFLHFLNGHT